ncbi:MAG: extracellular solute-binding protein, partial [Vallitaleaceae bacterium]|nr:extracellular solute-binding protein [Vallitaleaceae bacterium]
MPWDSGPVALYYRTDVFEKAGLPTDPAEVSNLLKTWDDYYNTAKIIKEKTGSFMFPESQEKSTGRNFEKLLWQQGNFYFNEAGVPQLDNPEAVKAMTFLTKFVKEGLADNTEEWTQPWYDSLANGNVATIFAASWMGGFFSSWIAPDAVGLWKVVPLPTWPGSTNTAANDGGSNLVVSDTSKNKDAAWAYVEFMLGREESQLNMYKTMDVFPSLETTYSDEFFNEDMPYFGNQKVRSVFADTVSQIPVISYTKNYSQANESLKEAYAKIIYNNISVEQALKEANDQVKSKIE